MLLRYAHLGVRKLYGKLRQVFRMETDRRRWNTPDAHEGEAVRAIGREDFIAMCSPGDVDANRSILLDLREAPSLENS
jgi:hypothetical protein